MKGGSRLVRRVLLRRRGNGEGDERRSGEDMGMMRMQWMQVGTVRKQWTVWLD